MSELSQNKKTEPHYYLFLYSRIREDDQDALVRATMHMQSEQLRHRQ